MQKLIEKNAMWIISSDLRDISMQNPIYDSIFALSDRLLGSLNPTEVPIVPAMEMKSTQNDCQCATKRPIASRVHRIENFGKAVRLLENAALTCS